MTKLKPLTYSTMLAICATAPTMAMATYQLYGRVQAEFNGEGISGVTAPVDGIGVDDDAGASHWGIRGEEDLGGGLAAFTRLEFGIDPADNDAEFNREQYIGLKGAFGSLSVGRQEAPYKYYGGVSYDPFARTHIQARRAGGMSGNANGFGHNGYVSNSIVYQSPDLWGMQMAVLLMPDETSAGTEGDMDYSIGLRYRLGSMMEAIVAHNHLNTAASQPDERMTKIGGKLVLGIHTLTAQYEWIENASSGTGNNAGAATGASFFGPYSGIGTCPATTTGARCTNGLNGGTDGTIWFASYQMKLGNFTVGGALGKTEADNVPATPSTPRGIGNEVFFWSAGMIYNFSKSFNLFVGWAESDENLDLGSNAARVIGSDRDVWTVGMRKDF